MKDLVVVNDAAAADAGAVVFWRLEGAMDIETLTRAWGKLGLPADWLPSAATPAVALRLAMDAVRAGGDVMRGHEGGIALFQKRVHPDANPSYEMYMHAAAKDDGTLSFKGPAVDDGDALIQQRVIKEYESALTSISTMATSHWLSDIVGKLAAVALRDRGGVYYIPPTRVGDWRKVCEAIALSSAHTISEIPALPSKQAAQAIIAAISSEAEAYADSLLAKAAEGEMGARACAAREADVQAYFAKLTTYEAIVGEKLESLREKMVKVSAALAVASLAAA